DKLERVLINVLANAFKFTPAKGRIRCTLERKGDRAILSVADSGPGIRPEDREAVFERFRQLDGGATRQVGGTGLGLAIAQEFVELHGGTITVDDAPEGGACFTIELPLRAPEGSEIRRGADALSTKDQSELAQRALAELRTKVDTAPSLRDKGKPLVLVVE